MIHHPVAVWIVMYLWIDYDWKPKGNKNFDVGGRKSGLDLCPVTKPPQCDPGIYYPQPIVRGQKDTAPGEKKKLNWKRSNQKSILLQRSMEGPKKVQVQKNFPNPKRENHLQKSK